ncbi:MAG TPA: hypothetical protein VFF73_09345, partial [Planctomycetota bacterium]|nr:hypothetical protein [Planctomycetota bacterium]
VYLPPDKGTYELSLTLPDLSPTEKPAVTTINVRYPDAEFKDPRLDEQPLVEIAQATGGALVTLVPLPPDLVGKVTPVTLQNLPDKIPDRTETLVVAGQPVPLWDNRTTLILACTLLGLEWFFRKRCRMV